ncbi:DUF5615 family PIN-like protein [Halomicrobium zhouii]|uniref:DUF5615 family PIN-like protein n=1 Tax=Halomicrobium zhouii TaxID=767519 RepID=UPI0015A62099
MQFLTDEHVPRVFISALCSNGHEVLRANGALGEGTDDEQQIEFCADDGRIPGRTTRRILRDPCPSPSTTTESLSTQSRPAPRRPRKRRSRGRARTVTEPADKIHDRTGLARPVVIVVEAG